MAQGHASHAASEHEGGHVHQLSPSPIVVALGALLLYIGFALGSRPLAAGKFTAGVGVLALGVLIFVLGLLNWVREDTVLWREGHVDHGVMPGRDIGWWGMMFFLGTEITLFGGLFASFFITRADVPEVWVAAHEHLAHALPLVTINTLILIASGVTCHLSLHALRKNNRKAFLGLLAVTIVLGAIFLGVQVREYADLISAGVTLAGSQFGSVFYLLTGTHAFHVFLGIALLGIVFVRGLKGQMDAKRHVAFDTFAIYWHFVDIVWIGLYLVVYVGVI